MSQPTKLDLKKLFDTLYAIRRERGKATEIQFDLTEFPSAEAAARTIGVFQGLDRCAGIDFETWVKARVEEWKDIPFNPPKGGIIAQLQSCHSH